VDLENHDLILIRDDAVRGSQFSEAQLVHQIMYLPSVGSIRESNKFESEDSSIFKDKCILRVSTQI
jgi:hypothetical protein